ncbi:MAG: phospholipase D-like domain-containing protein [Sideroxyarcus sp.]|nr:phospholipase D-like domain-containing protein [Sideroxyarcus sp.]
MKSLTISEGFRRAIGEREVTRAFFSTYCFEPDFFELEVMPLLLGGAVLSTDETIRYHQVQSLMSNSRDRFAVGYDVDVFNPQCASRLEVDYLPVRVDGACQHAKLAVLEVVDATGKVAIILAAGSFNLTKAGWWTNIEVGHWVELNHEYAPRNIVAPLADALAYFQAHRAVPALAALQARLAEWKIRTNDDACTFYFSGAGPKRSSFPGLLKYVSTKYIEIVSPFFADQGDNAKVASFLKRFDKVSLLLPTDENGVATMTQAVYSDLSKLANWCEWHSDMRSDFAFARRTDEFRKLHAKIYSGESWLFIGSVNLSCKAFHQNVEAGFLLTKTPRLKLMSALPEQHTFSPVDPVEAPSNSSEIAMPPLHLAYDWRSGELEALSPVAGELTLYDAEGIARGKYPLEKNLICVLIIEGLSVQLKHSALIGACWTDPEGRCSDRRSLLVSQRQVYCRPSSLPELDVQDLLRIFQNMQPEKRMAAITALAVKQARLSKSGLTSNEFLPPLPAAECRTNFFSEFSEVNGGFWNLRNKLATAQKKGRIDELAYYLDGQQPDSLRGLARALGAADQVAHVSGIVRYLTLLSMDEVLAVYQTASDDLARDVQGLITATEQSDEFNALPDKVDFLNWIKEKFSMPVSQVNLSTNQQEQNNG